VIFSDATLRELARVRPSTLEKMRLLYGVGEMKLRDFGPAFLKLIAEHCSETGVSGDASPPPIQRPLEPVPAGRAGPRPGGGGGVTPGQEELFVLFRKRTSVEDAMTKTGLARSTVMEYLASFVQSEKPADLKPWVDEVTLARVREAARQVGAERLKPIFLAL